MKISKKKSNAINKTIRNIEDNDNIKYECWPDMDSGKKFPYIGWYWRDVDFSADSCVLAILPIFMSTWEQNLSTKVGFMENNKWGYKSFIIKGKNWDKLRGLILVAIKNKTSKSLNAVRDFMQSLL